MSVRKNVIGLFAAIVLGMPMLATEVLASEVLALEASSTTAGTAQSQEPGASTKIRDDSRIGRYTTMDGGKAFILDRTGDKARLRFARSPEILVLETVPGPQGVTYFKDEFGRTILRLMPRGGATLYDEEGNEGDAYGREKMAKPLELKPRGLNHVHRRSKEIESNLKEYQKLKLDLVFEPTLEILKAKSEIAAAEMQLTRLRQEQQIEEAAVMASDRSLARSVAATAPPSTMPDDGLPKSKKTVGRPKTATTIADAVEVLNVALKRLAKDDLAREVMAERIDQILFRAAEETNIALVEETLVISYVPGKGVDGRPSSVAIEQYLLENL